MNSIKVLVADDYPDTADSVASLLRRDGVEVRTAADGEAAVRAASGWGPDLVILDLSMPRMDGYEVCRRLKADPNLARARVVAYTGYHTAQHRQAAFEAGFDAFLPKPADPDALLEVLKTCTPSD